MDEVTLLATITMFLVWGPDEIAQTPAIQTQCVGVFKDCWGSKNPEVSVQMDSDINTQAGLGAIKFR